MQLVDNISSSSLSFLSLCFMIFHLRLTWEGWGEHDAVEELKEEKVLYLVKCRNDESEKALTNACLLAEKSQCMSEGMPGLFFFDSS